MDKIIIDTNIILKHPKILGIIIPETEFLIPIDVIEELNSLNNYRGSSLKDTVDLIEKASHVGNVSIINTSMPRYFKYRNDFTFSKLKGADFAIVALAIELSNGGEVVKIATQDKDIWDLARLYNIDILSETDINKFLSEFLKYPIDKTLIQKDILAYEQNERNGLWKGIIIGISASIIGVLVYENIKYIISSVNIWGTIFMTIILGVILFIFREKKRLSYGVFEFFVGVISIFMLFKPINFDFSKINLNAEFNIKFLGGLYIMVRGQDNIVKGLKNTKAGIILKEKYGIGL